MDNNTLKYIFFLGCISLLAACDSAKKECPLGTPKPIFSPDMAGISQHHFSAKGQESLEELVLDRGVYVSISQSGCDALRQEFQFKVQGNYGTFPDSLWLKEAVRQFYHLGNLSEKTAGLKMWASAIEAERPTMRIAEPKQLDQNIYVQIDKLVSPEESTLRVVLLQK